MKSLISVFKICSVLMTSQAYEPDQYVEILEVLSQESTLPRLTILNLHNTGLSEQQTAEIEGYLSLPDWASDEGLITDGKKLRDNLRGPKKFSLIRNLIQQKIDRFQANRTPNESKSPALKRARKR